MEQQTAKNSGSVLRQPRGQMSATSLAFKEDPAGGKPIPQASGPLESSYHSFTGGLLDMTSHRNLPGRPVSVLRRGVNLQLPLLLSHEPAKKRAAGPLVGKPSDNLIPEVKALKRQDCGDSCGAPLGIIHARSSPYYWEDDGLSYRQQLMKIPMTVLGGPMCIKFHGSYPISVRPTRRDLQEPGSLKTYPHRAAWLAAKWLTSLDVVPATGREANERSWRRNEDEDDDFLAFIETLLDDPASRKRRVHAL